MWAPARGGVSIAPPDLGVVTMASGTTPECVAGSVSDACKPGIHGDT